MRLQLAAPAVKEEYVREKQSCAPQLKRDPLGSDNTRINDQHAPRLDAPPDAPRPSRGAWPRTRGPDPWRAWVLFKHYARVVDETPDPGVSVQIRPHRSSGEVSLFLVRQVVEAEEEWLRPVGGVVCEFVFEDSPATATEAEFWTFDSSTFARCVDRVESHPGFNDLIARRPTSSMVYWEEA